MNAPATTPTIPAIGAPFEGGFFAGLLTLNGERRGLIMAAKAFGQHGDTKWHDSYEHIEDATSYVDGLANTNAMAAAGSKIAQWARAQTINGFTDWCIPAQDQLEMLYRHFKPTQEENNLWGRSGLNASALPPTYPYASNAPTQTPLALFQEGGEEALEPEWYLSSTQHAGDDDCAHCQYFGDGIQGYSHESSQYRVVLVRSIPL